MINDVLHLQEAKKSYFCKLEKYLEILRYFCASTHMQKLNREMYGVHDERVSEAPR